MLPQKVNGITKSQGEGKNMSISLKSSQHEIFHSILTITFSLFVITVTNRKCRHKYKSFETWTSNQLALRNKVPGKMLIYCISLNLRIYYILEIHIYAKKEN